MAKARSTLHLAEKTQVEVRVGRPPTWTLGTISYVSLGSHYIVDLPQPHGRVAVTPGHEDLRLPGG